MRKPHDPFAGPARPTPSRPPDKPGLFPWPASPMQDWRMIPPVDPVARREAIRVRPAAEPDMAAVREIYAHYVLNSLATFEEAPPTL